MTSIQACKFNLVSAKNGKAEVLKSCELFIIITKHSNLFLLDRHQTGRVICLSRITIAYDLSFKQVLFFLSSTTTSRPSLTTTLKSHSSGSHESWSEIPTSSLLPCRLCSRQRSRWIPRGRGRLSRNTMRLKTQRCRKTTRISKPNLIKTDSRWKIILFRFILCACQKLFWIHVHTSV